MTTTQRRLAAYALAEVLLGLATSGVVLGQERPSVHEATARPATPAVPAPTYGPLEAGQDAYQFAETQRRAALARQLETINQMTWWDTRLAGPGTVPSLESFYAYPRSWRATRYGQGTGPQNSSAYGDDHGRNVFEPWPLVPGDIFSHSQVERIPQPVGHEIVVTGPNSYIYRPVYPGETIPPRQKPLPGEVLLPPPPSANPPAAMPPSSAARGPGEQPRLPMPPLPQPDGEPREF